MRAAHAYGQEWLHMSHPGYRMASPTKTIGKQVESTSFSVTSQAPDGINGAEVGNLLGYRKTIARNAAANEVFASLVAPKFGVNVPPVVVLGREFDRVTIMSVGIRGKSYFQYRNGEMAAGRDLPRAKVSAGAYLDNYAPELAAFDKAIGNTDRHGGNFIMGEDGQTWGIDHEFLGGSKYREARETYAEEWAVACSLTGYTPSAVEFAPVEPIAFEVRNRKPNGAISGCQCGCAEWSPAPELVSAELPESPMGDLDDLLSAESWDSPVESYPVRDSAWSGAARCSLGCCPA